MSLLVGYGTEDRSKVVFELEFLLEFPAWVDELLEDILLDWLISLCCIWRVVCRVKGRRRLRRRWGH